METLLNLKFFDSIVTEFTNLHQTESVTVVTPTSSGKSFSSSTFSADDSW